MQRGLEVVISRVDQTFAWSKLHNSLARDNLIPVILEENSETTVRQTAPAYLEPIVTVCVQRPNQLAEAGPAENTKNHPFDFTFLAGVDSVSESVSRLFGLLEEKTLLARDESEMQRDEQILIERLTDLGYL
jgi:hypothetical protein